MVALATTVLLGTPSGVPGQGVRGPTVLTREQAAGLEQVRYLIQETARTYGIPPPVAVRIAPWVETTGALTGAGGVSSGGRLYLGPGALTSRHRDALVAAALAHVLVQRPSQARSLADFNRERRQQFMDTHAKAVEVLMLVKGWPEWMALDMIYEWLIGQHRAEPAAQRTAIGQGRATACEEIADLLGRYVQQRAWTEGLACAAGPVPGPTAIRASAEPPALLFAAWSPPPPPVSAPLGPSGTPAAATAPPAAPPWWCSQPGHRLRYVQGCS
jgi:hypothetical protein